MLQKIQTLKFRSHFMCFVFRFANRLNEFQDLPICHQRRVSHFFRFLYAAFGIHAGCT